MKQRNNIVYKILKEMQDTISEYFIQNQENYTNKRADKKTSENRKRTRCNESR